MDSSRNAGGGVARAYNIDPEAGLSRGWKRVGWGGGSNGGVEGEK